MEERYVAFDVETPNAQNRRMSAIGVSVIERGEIVQELYTLVDPQTHFDPFNIALTGITPEQVRGQPDFPALWQLLEPMLAGCILVAHNAVCTIIASTGSRRPRICAPARWAERHIRTCRTTS